MQSAAGSVFFQRLGWTTDGQYILAGGAKNSHASVCVSIARGGFAREVDLVGHAAPVTAVVSVPLPKTVQLISIQESKPSVICAQGRTVFGASLQCSCYRRSRLRT